MFRRENLPLVVMTLVSLAILLVFIASSNAMGSTPRQLAMHSTIASTGPVPAK
jgi:hypothetical protein